MKVEWSQGQAVETAIEVWNTEATLTAVLDAILSDTDDVARVMEQLGLLKRGLSPAGGDSSGG